MVSISLKLIITMLAIATFISPTFAGQRPHHIQSGLAVFYAKSFQGARTASGEHFNHGEYVAAHPDYPLGSLVRVTNLKNGRSVIVRINDRGPTARVRARGVIIDLSREAAESLGFIKQGRAPVKLTVVKTGDDEAMWN